MPVTRTGQDASRCAGNSHLQPTALAHDLQVGSALERKGGPLLERSLPCARGTRGGHPLSDVHPTTTLGVEGEMNPGTSQPSWALKLTPFPATWCLLSQPVDTGQAHLTRLLRTKGHGLSEWQLPLTYRKRLGQTEPLSGRVEAGIGLGRGPRFQGGGWGGDERKASEEGGTGDPRTRGSNRCGVCGARRD